MNIQQDLSIEQQENRVLNANEVYNSGLVEKLNKHEYLVKGKYIVEDLTEKGDISQYFMCSCKDHEYRRVECKHILAVQFYILNNDTVLKG